MQMNFPSALVGAASLGVVLLTVSTFQAPTGSSPARQLFSTLGITIDGPVQVEGIPAPNQIMRVVEGTPLTVPVGKIFVAVSLGSLKGGSHTTELHFDSAKVFQVTTSGALAELPRPYIAAGPGTVVEPMFGDGDPDDAEVWGYLGDA